MWKTLILAWTCYDSVELLQDRKDEGDREKDGSLSDEWMVMTRAPIGFHGSKIKTERS